METPPPLICSHCQTLLPPNSNFCLNCGKKIKEPPVSTTVLKQIALYALSFLLPPLGLWPASKYLRQPDPKAKTIGLVCVILTIISTALTIWATLSVINSFNQTLNSQLGSITSNPL